MTLSWLIHACDFDDTHEPAADHLRGNAFNNASDAYTKVRYADPSGAVTTVHQLGFAFGIAVLGTVFASRAASSIADQGVPNSAKVAHTLAGG
jgi:hypothetical protein